MPEKIHVRISHDMASDIFRFDALRQYDLACRSLHSVVGTGCITSDDILGTAEPPGIHVHHHPRTRSPDKRLAFCGCKYEIPQEKWSGRALVPGGHNHLIPPLRILQKLDVHSGEHPHSALLHKRIITETLLIGSEIGHLLGHIHEGSRFQAEIRIHEETRDDGFQQILVFLSIVTFHLFRPIVNTCSTAFRLSSCEPFS